MRHHLALGVEFSEMKASSSPDECLKLAPASCQGGAGTPAFFTNFERFQAEGIDFTANIRGFDVGNIGTFGAVLVAHKYLTNEFQTTALQPVIDCKGRYGNSCDPVPEFRSTLRLTWGRNDFDGSLLWRHISSMDAQANEASAASATIRRSSDRRLF